MLWYKSWRETRLRFLIGLALLGCSAGWTVLMYPRVAALIPLASAIDTGGELGRRVKEAIDLAREYRGYIWSQVFRQNVIQMWTVFAVLLGTGGLLSRSSGAANIYTLSLPVSRTRVLGVRAATGLVELLALAVVPSVIIPLLSPAIGEHYRIADALVHAAVLFVAGGVFFSGAFLLSTVFNDFWTPLLTTLAVAAVLAFAEQTIRDSSRFGVFGMMTGELYFRSGTLPWAGLLASVAASAAMLYAATINVARQDF
jgi:hypothetical protein